MATRIVSCIRRALTSPAAPHLLHSAQINGIQKPTSAIQQIASRRLMSSQTEEKYRKVTEETVGDVTTIEANYTEPPEDYHLVDNPHKACPICSRNLKVTYKDVLILNQFINPQGGMLPRRLTGVCKEQQRVLAKCLHKAHITGLIPDHKPPKVYGSFKEQNWKPRRKIRYHKH